MKVSSHHIWDNLSQVYHMIVTWTNIEVNFQLILYFKGCGLKQARTNTFGRVPSPSYTFWTSFRSFHHLLEHRCTCTSSSHSLATKALWCTYKVPKSSAWAGLSTWQTYFDENNLADFLFFYSPQNWAYF